MKNHTIHLTYDIDLTDPEAFESIRTCINNTDEIDLRRLAHKLAGELFTTRTLARPFAVARAHNPNESKRLDTVRTLAVKADNIAKLRQLYGLDCQKLIGYRHDQLPDAGEI